MQFGLYLVKQGVLTTSQFVEALEHQLASRPQLGALAIELGKLKVKDVFTILRAQADNPQELFGHLAVKSGQLTEDELTSLLYRQSVSVQPMAAVVVELGFLSPEVTKFHLAEYRADCQSPKEIENALTT